MDWLLTNGPDLLAAFGALVLAAGGIARLTPTKKDDEIVGVLQKALDYLSPGGIHRGRTK
jgi:hypothetical protein